MTYEVWGTSESYADVCEQLRQREVNLLVALREIESLKASLTTETARADKAERENDALRGLLAKGDKDCAYCQLPADKMGECKSGFPGCGRMDDIVNAVESKSEGRLLNAQLDLHSLQGQVERLTALGESLKASPLSQRWIRCEMPKVGEQVELWCYDRQGKPFVQLITFPDWKGMSVGWANGERVTDWRRILPPTAEQTAPAAQTTELEVNG